MTHRTLFTFAAIIGLFACSCTTHTPPDFKASVSTIQHYADSFTGVSVDEARSRLAGAKFSEIEWKEGGFGGKQLVATFPSYEVRVMYLGDKAITTSVQILSK
jgi:hypothetical protein